jgi:Uma2 family endonuclease
MSPQGSLHAWVVQVFDHWLNTALNEHAAVRVQSPLALSDDSEPEPDIAVVPRENYQHSHPRTALWIVEVADDSLRKDRGAKAALYAAAGVPEYWVVNLPERCVEIFTAPENARYTQLRTVRPPEILTPSVFPNLSLSFSALFSAP